MPAAVPRLAVVSAGTGQPSSTGLLADRLTAGTLAALGNADTVRGGALPDGALRDGAAGAAAEVSRVELRDLATQIAGHLVTGVPGERLATALSAVTSADALIAVTPVYNASYSGLFKSFFDLVDPTALAGTPVIVAATGGTPRHSLVLDHAMRPLFGYLRALTVPTGVYAATADWGGGADGAASGEDPLADRVGRAAAELAAQLGGRTPRAAGGATPAGGIAAAGPGLRPDGEPEADPDPEAEVVPFAQQLAAVRGR
nr:CE1759 family FMN reductase [Streptomyces otsuchiensis]